MKIPAHILSPAANNKGSQNAPMQNIAEFLGEQSETSNEFYSALKSLQNLAKPQKLNGLPSNADKDTPSLGAYSAKTKVAGLKFGVAQIEPASQSKFENDTHQNQEQSTIVESEKSADTQLNSKTTMGERSPLIDDVSSDTNALQDSEPTEPVLEEHSEAEVQVKIGGRAVDEVINIHRPSSAAGVEYPAKSATQDRAQNSAPMANSEQQPNGVSAKALELPQGAQAADSIPNTTQPLAPQNEISRVDKSPRIDIKRAPKGEAQSAETAPTKQVLLTPRSNAKFEAQFNPAQPQSERPLESKPAADNTPQIQLKGSTNQPLMSSTIPAMQTPPLATAKDVSTQVTRHLNSELLNMDLRTQIVSERAATSAINSSVLTLQLHPVGLGRVQAEIRKEGDLVRIKLTVEASGTFEILKNDIDALKAAMRALGTSEGDVTLTQGNINRLPNDAGNNGQNPFSNDRDAQSDLRERRDQDANNRTEQQFGAEENTSQASSSHQTQQPGNNTVFI